jgi:molecular chaperone GrpE
MWKKMSRKKNKEEKCDESQELQEQQTQTEPQAETKTEAAAEATPGPEELLAQANDRYLRARADFENYRKRMAREFNETRDNARMQTVNEFLPVYDMFCLAIEHARNCDDVEGVKQGLSMILNEFQRTFENLGVKKMQTENADFDPSLHEAISQEESDEIAEGKILREWKAGFTLNDKLLRPANVVVSAGKKNNIEC